MQGENDNGNDSDNIIIAILFGINTDNNHIQKKLYSYSHFRDKILSFSVELPGVTIAIKRCNKDLKYNQKPCS